MDMLGKNRIMENQGNTSSDQKTAIDISKLSKGVYTISIFSGKNVTYRKIVVQ